MPNPLIVKAPRKGKREIRILGHHDPHGPDNSVFVWLDEQDQLHIEVYRGRRRLCEVAQTFSPSILPAEVQSFRKDRMMETTSVIFRLDREGIVFALFPELPSDNYGYYCTAYQHIGQHSAANFQGCIAQSRPALADEYADLFEELERRGYHLHVHQRATPVMHERRRWIAAQWRGEKSSPSDSTSAVLNS